MKTSSLEANFLFLLKTEQFKDIPAPIREFVFAPPRKFRFDFYWHTQKVGLEIDGGVYRGGRHTSMKGFIADCDKTNLAVLKGIRVLHFTAHHLQEPLKILEILKQVLLPGEGKGGVKDERSADSRENIRVTTRQGIRKGD